MPVRIPRTIQKLAVPIDSVSEYPGNARRGDVDLVRDSLRARGQYRPVVVQKSTGHVLAGNHVYLVMRDEGSPKIAVTFVDVDDDEALAINLVDNRAGDRAGYDEDALVDLLQRARSLAATGYNEGDLESLIKRTSAPPAFGDAAASAGQTEHQCPACGYLWSGSPTPEAA